ncbi:MAG: M3 family oligoendopeptidase, partial [Candidatus Zixiibacteriota bacterium]
MTAANKIPPAPRWNLDSIFEGGSKSEAFRKHREKVKAALAETKATLAKLPASIDEETAEAWVQLILRMQTVAEDISLINNFVEALQAQDVSDAQADAVAVEGFLYKSQWDDLRTELEALAVKQSDSQWQLLLSDARLKGIEFYLNELREQARSKMPVELESLALELSVNGFHAWNQLYDKMGGELRADFEQDGKVNRLSMGQLATKMSDPDRAVRCEAFEKLTQSWEPRADLAAMILNSLAGFRLSLYNRRKWDSVLKEPLMMSRLKDESLEAMWAVVGRETKRLAPYIEAKKKLLGIDKFSWYDQFAPCGTVDKLYSYNEAIDFICDNFKPFSPEIVDFIRMAVEKRWIEAEDRPGKQGGAFCTRMGAFRETRVFMTYAGSYDNLLTLAHELGHSYHGWVLRDTPFFSTIYPMSLAESASNFFEAMVNDAALESTTDPRVKVMLLEQKLQAAYTMFTDLHCRYLFDRAFYAERQHGVVGKDRLNELMVEAQKKAFGSLLDESGHHPLFWCTKLHFFLSQLPLYNFPYTFGYLFAGGVYDRAKKEGTAFAEQYKNLLADSGS